MKDILKKNIKMLIVIAFFLIVCNILSVLHPFVMKGILDVDIKSDNIKIILSCIDLIEGVIQPGFFMEQLVILEQNTEDFYFKSINAVIKKYGWNNKCGAGFKKAAGEIRQGCYNMINLLKNKREWKNIWKAAYNIHNLPILLIK